MSENSLASLFDKMAGDLMTEPMQISAHHDLPFAILCYPPEQEMEARKLLRLTAARVNEAGKRVVHFVSLARLFWKGLSEVQGMEKLANYEREWGISRLEGRIAKLLAHPKFVGIESRIEQELAHLNPDRDVVFLVRSSVFAPRLYRVSVLLEGLYRKTRVPSILFYPGIYEGGNALRFMNLSGNHHLASPQYRVNIYGNER